MTSQRTRNRLVARLRDQGVADEQVLSRIAQVPRHIFVDEALAHRAYEDTALPIGLNQTISQPFIVARMTELLLAGRADSGGPILEVGTGCGYQTAVLAGLVERVCSVERLPELAQRARANLRALRIGNVHTRVADGYAGWTQHAPFAGIIVTAAPPQMPADLLAQLAIGGRLVLPVGDRDGQVLVTVDRTEQGLLETRHERVMFVPMLTGVGAARQAADSLPSAPRSGR